jgi:hypothetical protein
MFVMILFMIYKVFQQNMANVLMIKQEKFIHLVFVSSFILSYLNNSNWILLDALANTIKNCITGLSEIPDKEAKYYCGYTLMKYCAVHLGLDQIPLNQEY